MTSGNRIRAASDQSSIQCVCVRMPSNLLRFPWLQAVRRFRQVLGLPGGLVFLGDQGCQSDLGAPVRQGKKQKKRICNAIFFTQKSSAAIKCIHSFIMHSGSYINQNRTTNSHLFLEHHFCLALRSFHQHPIRTCQVHEEPALYMPLTYSVTSNSLSSRVSRITIWPLQL